MIIHIVRNEIRPGTAEPYTEAARDFMAYVKENCPGCLSARVLQDTENENIIANLIEWEDMDSLKAHLSGDALSRFVDRLGPYFAGNSVEIYTVQ